MRRVSVVGSTCSGKTTFAREHWGADWMMVDEARFRERVDQATSGDAWVVDGNYGGRGARFAIRVGAQDLLAPQTDLRRPARPT